MDQHECPKIRMVEAMPVEIRGRRCLFLRDPMKLTGNDLALPIEVAFILTLMDGMNTVLDIKAEFVRRTGLGLATGQVDQLLETLDENLMLENRRFQNALNDLERSFRQRATRTPFLAGTSYPADQAEITAMIDGFYRHEKGPGTAPIFGEGEPARGLVAPHIDMNSGGPAFAWAYHALAQSSPPDRFVILGTGHQGADNLFALTMKDFETPLGVTATDKTFVDRLVSGAQVDYFKDELLHRTEHVIEFQVLFLQHLYGGSARFPIVPILCSLDPEFFFRSEFESKTEIFRDFVSRLNRAIADSPGRTCVIASVDLDHVGPRYGDNFYPGQAEIDRSLDADRELLALLSQGDDDRFLHTVRRLNPRHKICGFSPLYTMMKAMQVGTGRLLSLDYTMVDNQNSFVTFAAMVFS